MRVRPVSGGTEAVHAFDLVVDASGRGSRTPMVNFINWYMGKLHIASRQDPKVTLAFQKVANLLSPPPSILHPALAVRIARGNIGARH